MFLYLTHSLHNLKNFNWVLVLDKRYLCVPLNSAIKLDRIQGATTWGYWKVIIAGGLEKIRTGSTPELVVSLPLFPFWHLLTWSYWSWNPEVGTRVQIERAPGEFSGSAWNVVKIKRSFFPFCPPYSCIQALSSFHGSINNDGSRSQTSERGGPSSPNDWAVVPARWNIYTLLFFCLSVLVLLGCWVK